MMRQAISPRFAMMIFSNGLLGLGAVVVAGQLLCHRAAPSCCCFRRGGLGLELTSRRRSRCCCRRTEEAAVPTPRRPSMLIGQLMVWFVVWRGSIDGGVLFS